MKTRALLTESLEFIGLGIFLTACFTYPELFSVIVGLVN
jgi:hypothetical protein